MSTDLLEIRKNEIRHLFEKDNRRWTGIFMNWKSHFDKSPEVLPVSNCMDETKLIEEEENMNSLIYF